MSLDIREDHLLIVKNILKKIVPHQRVIVFGSRVKGAAKKHSDLDLCVIGTEPLSFEKLAELRNEFSDSNIPYKVDIVDWSYLDDSFKKIITEQYSIIQE